MRSLWQMAFTGVVNCVGIDICTEKSVSNDFSG